MNILKKIFFQVYLKGQYRKLTNKNKLSFSSKEANKNCQNCLCERSSKAEIFAINNYDH